MMLLSNFRLILDASFAIAIEAMGIRWDLHNLAEFLGFTYDASSQTVTLHWDYFTPDLANAQKYLSHPFNLVFTQTRYFEVTPRDPAMPTDEDQYLDTVSFIRASGNALQDSAETHEYLHASIIPSFDPEQSDKDIEYHLFFRFRGGQIIRIGADKAEFVPVKDNSR